MACVYLEQCGANFYCKRAIWKSPKPCVVWRLMFNRTNLICQGKKHFILSV